MIRKVLCAWTGFCSFALLVVPACVLHAQRAPSPTPTPTPTPSTPAIPEEWAITGTAVTCGNVYQDIPTMRVTTPAAARTQTEAAVRSVLRCLGRPESDAAALMAGQTFNSLKATGYTAALKQIDIDGSNRVTVWVVFKK